MEVAAYSECFIFSDNWMIPKMGMKLDNSVCWMNFMVNLFGAAITRSQYLLLRALFQVCAGQYQCGQVAVCHEPLVLEGRCPLPALHTI